MRNKNIIIIVLVLAAGISGFLLFKNKESSEMSGGNAAINANSNVPGDQSNGNSGASGANGDLLAFSILPNTQVHGILSYRGTLQGSYFFEGNVLINVLDANKNVLKKSNAVATTDWMTAGPVDFEGNIDFTGLPTGPGYIQIHNDNASGLPENDKEILIPIIIN